MSDEAKRVEVSVPRSMIIATTSNVVMLFAFVLILLYCIGDLDAVYTDNPRLPLITVFYQATKSKGGTTVLVALPALVIFFTSFNAYASVSRLIWSFAKDNGLPFSPVFSHVSLSTPQASLTTTHMIGLDFSKIWRTSQRAYFDICILNDPIDHLRLFNYSLQCFDITPGVGTERVIHPSNPFRFNSQTHWQASAIWPIRPGPLGNSGQCSWLGVSHLHSHLDAFPDDASCNGHQFQLCRADPWLRHCCGSSRFCNIWSEAIPNTYSRGSHTDWKGSVMERLSPGSGSRPSN